MNYVYKFISDDNRLLYIGKTKNIKNRMSSHFSKNGHLPDDCLCQVARIDFKKLDDMYDVDYIEKQLIQYFQPEYNQIYKNKKVYSIPSYLLEDWDVYKNIRPIIISDPNNQFKDKKESKPYKWGIIDILFIIISILLWFMIAYGVWNLTIDFIEMWK